MAMKFNPPPNWPKPPAHWKPSATWRPDPAWGPAPEGWQLWIEESETEEANARPEARIEGTSPNIESAGEPSVPASDAMLRNTQARETETTVAENSTVAGDPVREDSRQPAEAPAEPLNIHSPKPDTDSYSPVVPVEEPEPIFPAPAETHTHAALTPPGEPSGQYLDADASEAEESTDRGVRAEPDSSEEQDMQDRLALRGPVGYLGAPAAAENPPASPEQHRHRQPVQAESHMPPVSPDDSQVIGATVEAPDITTGYEDSPLPEEPLSRGGGMMSDTSENSLPNENSLAAEPEPDEALADQDYEEHTASDAEALHPQSAAPEAPEPSPYLLGDSRLIEFHTDNKPLDTPEDEKPRLGNQNAEPTYGLSLDNTDPGAASDYEPSVQESDARITDGDENEVPEDNAGLWQDDTKGSFGLLPGPRESRGNGDEPGAGRGIQLDNDAARLDSQPFNPGLLGGSGMGARNPGASENSALTPREGGNSAASLIAQNARVVHQGHGSAQAHRESPAPVHSFTPSPSSGAPRNDFARQLSREEQSKRGEKAADKQRKKNPEPQMRTKAPRGKTAKPNFFTTPLGWVSIGGIILLIILLILALLLLRPRGSSPEEVSEGSPETSAAASSTGGENTGTLKKPSGDFKEYSGAGSQTISIERPRGKDSKAFIYYDFIPVKERDTLSITGKGDKDQAAATELKDTGNPGTPITGSTWLDTKTDTSQASTQKLQIETDGQWTVRVYDASAAPQYGKGDTISSKQRNYVFTYTGGVAAFEATTTGENNGYNFFKLDAIGKGTVIGTNQSVKTTTEWKDSSSAVNMYISAPYTQWSLHFN